MSNNKQCNSSDKKLISKSRKLNVCMVCDFFYPELGGVEMHIWCLSQCLLQVKHYCFYFFFLPPLYILLFLH